MEIGKYTLIWAEVIYGRTVGVTFINKNFKDSYNFPYKDKLYESFIKHKCKYYIKGKFGKTILDTFSYESFSATLGSLHLIDGETECKWYVLCPVKLRYKDKLLLENKNFIWSTLWS